MPINSEDRAKHCRWDWLIHLLRSPLTSSLEQRNDHVNKPPAVLTIRVISFLKLGKHGCANKCRIYSMYQKWNKQFFLKQFTNIPLSKVVLTGRI